MSNPEISSDSASSTEVSGVPDRGAFVVGVDRSGTSLLMALLDGHPEVMAAPKESFGTNWCGAPDPVAAFFEQTKYDALVPRGTAERDRMERALRDRIEGPTDLDSAIQAFIEALAFVFPPPPTAHLWIEKTPKHLRSTPVLLNAFGPATRIVCVVRDPRAVMASQAQRWNRHSIRQIRHFTRRWALSDELTRLFDAAYRRFQVVRYEDLVLETRETMERVANHLEITWSDELLEPVKYGRPWGGNSSYGKELKGVSTESLEQYAQTLEPIQIEELDHLLASRMLKRGYRPRTDGAKRPNWRRYLMELRARHKLRRHLRHWRREGIEPAVRE